MTLQAPAQLNIDDWREAFKSARIPPVVYNMKLSDDARLAPLSSYLNSSLYVQDKKAGIGAHVYGTLACRMNGFPMFARGMVIKKDNVFYVSLVDLVHALTEDGHPLSEDIDEVSGLFVTGMQDEFDFPFERYHRSVVQNFFTKRFERGQRNYFSTAKPLAECGWWSTEFAEYQTQFVRQLKV